MSNVALKKKVMEHVKQADQVVDGNTTKYNGSIGFAYFPWPGTLTVDLDESYDITCIRFLIWDDLGSGNSMRNPRKYGFRLLVSQDCLAWTVLYDSPAPGTNGWQVFEFPDKIQARYVRVHGLFNTGNWDFHVVQMEVYDAEAPELTATCMMLRVMASKDIPEETEVEHAHSGDMLKAIADIEEMVQSKAGEYLNKNKFEELVAQLRLGVDDIRVVERSLYSIRREVLAPVRGVLSLLSRTGRWGLWIGGIGGLLAILSIIMNLIN